MRGVIVTKNAGLFSVESNGNTFVVPASGKARMQGLFVGDEVEFDGAVNNVLPRKNLLIRPPIANIDKLFIVISPSPKPDFLLVDKILIYSYINGIEPVLVINKTDIADCKFEDNVEKSYNFLTIIKVSAKNGEIFALRAEIYGICAFAGQSAVGKSSLINALLGESVTEVGELSKKIERGKQTTRIVKLYKFENGYLADTAGFSMLDLSMVSDLKKEEISSYYPDFLQGRRECKYRSCLHTHGDCGVIKKVQDGEISKLRYDNYLKILTELDKNKKF